MTGFQKKIRRVDCDRILVVHVNIDQFTECDYDVNYKVEVSASRYSNILQLSYYDGARLELDVFADCAEQSTTRVAARNSMAQGRIGPQGRIFPTVLAPGTVPRLWAAREEAIRIQNENFNFEAHMMVDATILLLSVPVMPAEMDGKAATSGLKATRIRKGGGAPAGGGPKEPEMPSGGGRSPSGRQGTTEWPLPREAIDKVPEDWAPVRATQKKVGLCWADQES